MSYFYGILKDTGMTDILYRMPLPPQPTRAARSTAAASRDHASPAKAGAASVSQTTAATLVSAAKAAAHASAAKAAAATSAPTNSATRYTTRTVHLAMDGASGLDSPTPRCWAQARPQRRRPIQRHVRRRIKAVQRSALLLDYLGHPTDRSDIFKIGHAMSRHLRHSESLVDNDLGFTSVDDLISAMWIEDRVYATPAQVYFVVARDRKLRCQLVHQRDSVACDPRSFVIRAVQGHSTSIQRQMNHDMAHQLVWGYTDMSHATYSYLLPQIIGLGAPGLLPGGRGANGIFIALPSSPTTGLSE
jgi:hypothetical protein